MITVHVPVLGEFGVVYKGYVKKGDSHSIEEYLAIKTLKGMLISIVCTSSPCACTCYINLVL